MTDTQKELLIDLYKEFNIPSDRLPYSEEYVELCEKFNSKQRSDYTKAQIWGFLYSIRKSGHLPRLTKRRVKPPILDIK